MSPATRIRVAVVAAVPVVIGVGLAARFGLAGAVANSAGVALWSVLVYLLVLFARPTTGPLGAFGTALAISYGVEAFQLTGIPLRLADVSVLFRLALGTHFAWDDFPGYTVGCAVAAAIHWAILRRSAPLRRGNDK